MAATVISIYQRALSAIGTRTAIASVDEVSREAEVCTQWYESVRDLVFSTAPWPTLKRTARLGLLATRDENLAWAVTDPEPGYPYAYGEPADMLRPRYFANYSRFVRGMVNGTGALMSTTESAILFYTGRETNPLKWGINLEDAVVHALAAHIVMGLTGQRAKQITMFQLAEQKIWDARVAAANQDNFLPETTPEWIAARGSSYGAPVSRYIYPNADFSVAGMGNVS